MIGVYKLLDLVATLVEACVLMLITSCICKCNRAKVFWLIPLIMHVVITYFLTWFTGIGEYRTIVITLLDIAIFYICFKDSLLNVSTGVMFSLIIVLLAEPFAFLLAEMLHMRMDITINGTLFAYWPLYILVMAFRVIMALIVRHFMKTFVYKIKVTDFIPVFLDFLIVQIVFIIYYDKFFEGDTGYFNKTWEVLFAVVSMGFVLHFLYTKNYFAVKSMKEHNEYIIGQMEKQFAFYQDKLKEEERVRSIYHDLKNHLLLLESEDGKEEVQRMITSLKSQLSDYENYCHTGNDFLDIIIRDKAKAAKENQIDFSAAIQFEAGGFIEPLDISTIFGNALDNAIEASMKLSPGERLITVKAGRVRDMLSVVVENNAVDSAHTTWKTDKKDEFLHGFGLANIKNIVEKYDGECTVKQTGSRFVMKIIIPVPEQIICEDVPLS